MVIYFFCNFRGNLKPNKMKKTLLLLTILISTLSYSQTTTGGPDNFGYTYSTSNATNGPSYSWFDISVIGSPVLGLADDNFVGPFAISNFPYYSSTPTQYWIGSNGFISFQPVNIASTNAQFPAIPQTGAPDNFIAPLLTDLNLSGTGNPGVVYRYDQGDTICITFEKVPFWINNTSGYGGDNSFQIILNKADSSITFNYKTQIGSPDPTYTTNYLSIGIENPSGTDGLQYFRGTTFPSASTTVKYDFPTVVQAVTDVEVNYNNNTENGAEFYLTNSGVPYNPVVAVSNVGNRNVSDSISVTTQILNPFGAAVSTETITIDSLAVGVDSLINFSSFFPSLVGKHIVRSWTSGVINDGITSNDTNVVFFNAVDATKNLHELNYADGPSTGGIGWSGGNGGCAVYIEPPYYPAYINSSTFYIATTGTLNAGYNAIIYDDNGRAPGQGTILDSVFRPGSSIIMAQYDTVVPSNPITINSGGIYLHWDMDADGINLGRIITNAASNRTYEIISGAWSEYRDKTSQDFLMGIIVSPTPVGLHDYSKDQTSFSVYPNPTSELVTIQKENINKSTLIQLLDVNGKVQDVKTMYYTNEIQLITSTLSNGTYFIRVDKEIQPIVVKH